MHELYTMIHTNDMGKVRFGDAAAAAAAVFFLWMLVFFCFSITNSMGDNEEQEQRKKQSFWEWQRLRDAYSIYSALFTTSVGQYWGLFKALVNQAYAHFFPPNIDFRRGDEGQAATDNGAGEKLKEAIAKSLGTSKATVEDAAKSAADIAGETMNKAKEKVKRSLSGDRERDRQNEL